MTSYPNTPRTPLREEWAVAHYIIRRYERAARNDAAQMTGAARAQQTAKNTKNSIQARLECAARFYRDKKYVDAFATMNSLANLVSQPKSQASAGDVGVVVKHWKRSAQAVIDNTPENMGSAFVKLGFSNPVLQDAARSLLGDAVADEVLAENARRAFVPASRPRLLSFLFARSPAA